MSQSTPRMNSERCQDLAEVPEEGLSEEFLAQCCGGAELATVESLEMRVDTVLQSIDCLGEYLPNLRQLRLSSSSMVSIRELGTALQHLEVLWLSRCGLQDLDGVTVLPKLQELYIPFNDVADVSLLKWLDSLYVLDVEGNALSSMDDVSELSRCYQLRELTLVGNPVCSDAGYSRPTVLDMLSQLDVLDDASRDVYFEPPGSVTSAEPEGPVDPHIFLDLYLDLDQDLYLDLYLDFRDGLLPDEVPEGAETLLARTVREREARRGAADDSARRASEPSEYQLVVERLKRARHTQPLSAAALPHSARSASAMSAKAASQLGLFLPERRQAQAPESPKSLAEAASELTRGTSLAGNPLAALRTHRRQRPLPTARESEAGSELSIRDLLRRNAAA